jgi:ribonucleoside-diphosphate reductase beta chain
MSICSIISESKFDFFNIRFPEIQDFGDRQLKAFWMPSDVSYADDGKTFEILDEKTKHALKMVIGFFFSADGLVFSNMDNNFKDELKTQEVQYTYTAICMIELIHAQSYGRQLDALISDPTEKRRLMMAVAEVPAIKQMTDWAIKYTNRENYSLLERLIAFLCVEGVYFSSPFAFIFWLRQYHPEAVQGVVAANDLISRDENLHCEFAVHLINRLQQEGMSTDRGEEIFRSAVDVALEFVKDTLPNDMLDMNIEVMSRHVKSVANRWGTLIGLPLLYIDCKQTPFGFVQNISLEVKKNFFEKVGTEYQKAPIMDILFDTATLDELKNAEW